MTSETIEKSSSNTPTRTIRRTSRFAWFAVRLFTKSALLAITLVLALALNIATLTIPAVFNALSSLVGTASSLLAGKPMTVRASHTRRVANLHNRNLALAKQNKALSNRLETATHVNYRGRQVTVKKAVRQTTNRVARRTAIATTRNTASIAAEAIPYIGIAAILAATAMELNDACETMKDLHELEMAMDPSSADATEKNKVCGATVPSKDEVVDTIVESPQQAWEIAKAWYDDTPDIPDLPEWHDVQMAIGKTVNDAIEWWRTFLD